MSLKEVQPGCVSTGQQEGALPAQDGKEAAGHRLRHPARTSGPSDRAIDRFGQRIFTDDARDTLVGRHRSEKESLGAYATDICLYAQQGDPTFNQSKQEELTLQTFAQGWWQDSDSGSTFIAVDPGPGRCYILCH